ncbi:hypothetical protein [Actinomadura litoris]|uniref:hypothetical protein n=1 Tax=Actinomadura litoris TaxID=2678616 RepID=UPI001FA6B312|nr:hypothetical protein [Actinomadura litoris]
MPQPSESEGKVIIYVHGCTGELPWEEPSGGPGGWGVVLTYGRHRRELHGSAEDTPLPRLVLQATITALERLQRTEPVEIRSYFNASSVLLPGPDRGTEAELRHVAALAEPHRAVWSGADQEWWRDEYEMEGADHNLVKDLAFQGLVQALGQHERAGDPAAADMTLDTALGLYLRQERRRLSRRSYERVQDTIARLRRAVVCDGQAHLQDPPRTVTARLEQFHRILGLPDVEVEELYAARAVVPACLRWLAEHGHLTATASASGIKDVRDAIDRLIPVCAFITSLHWSAPQPPGDRTQPRYADLEAEGLRYFQITQVGAAHLTFTDPQDAEMVVGPVALPPDVCGRAEEGWEVLLTAERIDGEWFLTQVIDGRRP